MNVTYTVINSLDELDYDDLWERSKDAVQANWPDTPFDGSKERIREIIESGINNDWPGKHAHNEDDTHVMFKSEDSDTGLLLGLICGFLTTDGTFSGSVAFSTRDSTGSRNYIYTPQAIAARNQIYAEIGITKIKYNTILKNSSYHRLLKLRESSGTYTIIEELDQGDFVTITTELNLPT